MEGQILGRVHSVETFGAVDGPGVRYVVFFQGCPLRCLYCHNPDTWNRQAGREVSARSLLADIRDYQNYIRNGGVTLTGGEPLMQPEFACAILDGCRAMGVHTALDTSGAVALERAKPVIDRADLLLLDIKGHNAAISAEITGNAAAFDHAWAVLEYCESVDKPVWIRHVLLPGYTMSQSGLERLADALKPYRCIEKVELLPFHKMGEYKWKALGVRYRLEDIPAPDKAKVARAREIFESRGFPV
ncbi:MAG: pyruvate formate lyase-activating protein [Clostridiales bacterium]|nr:pyruvate formate lyase-activating protein [Clostridiales bacterium]